jgi:hypothetical protein
MRKSFRSFVFALLGPALLLGSASAVIQAAQAKATRWSDPASWPGRKVPVAGEKVEIASGKEVILDVSHPRWAV